MRTALIASTRLWYGAVDLSPAATGIPGQARGTHGVHAHAYAFKIFKGIPP